MHPLRSVVLATMTSATIAVAGCSGPTVLAAAGPAAGRAHPGADGTAAPGGLPAGPSPVACPATPGVSFADGWRATTEEQHEGVIRQCTWSADADGGDLVVTLTTVVIPRPRGAPVTGLPVFAVTPCAGDGCAGAATDLEVGAFARGIRPSDATAALFVDNPGQRGPAGHRHEWVDAEAWVITADHLCLSDLGAALAGYDRGLVDPLLAELLENAASACGLGS